jgi:CRP/FNR family transcriptional regulator, cyclic AMP receptor protein
MRPGTTGDSTIDQDMHGAVALAERIRSKELFARLCARVPSASHPPGRILFRQGDPADAIYYIGSGRVHRAITTERGDDRLLAILGPGDFCGEDCLSDMACRMTSAVVVEDAEVIRIEKSLMRELRRDWPDFADAFTSFLLTHGLETEAALIDQFVGSVEQRLGRLLLKLANVGSNAREMGTIRNVKQEMLAGLVGTTRPRVNYFLTRFRRLGLIDYGRAFGPGVIKVTHRLRQVCDRG